MSFTSFILITLLIAIAAAVQGSIGYGMALVANPVLALIDPHYVPGPMLICAFILSILIVYREGGSLDLRGLKWATIGRLAGTLVATGLLALLAPDVLIILFAVLVLIAVGITAGGFRLPINRPNLVLAGMLAGVMGTIASIGGPPMALLYQNESGARLRSTLAGFFIVGTFMSMTSLFLVGRFGWYEIKLGLGLIPGAFLGYFISTPLLKGLSPRLLRLGVLSVATVSALVVLAQQIF